MQNSDKSDLSLTAIAYSCSTGTCPTVYETNRGTIMVQGYTVTADQARAAGVDMPSGEQMVEIPLALLAEAAHLAKQS
ncbi:hypothetical protein [Actinoplanes subglobosus]|uniref:Uncharacterized protein n=1 Tax=Actinoplanes subglobosus TaxID=1547892 RepID=A0ABV8IPA6_9ACTN